MDARSKTESRLPSRHTAASDASTNVALHLPPIARDCEIIIAEIFKKTPCFPDSKPARRYVAKDLFNIDPIPLLKITLLDSDPLHSDCLIVAGRPIAETLKSEKSNPRRDLARAADILEVDAGVATLNVKLTDLEPAERKTRSKAGETNPTSDVLWTVGPGVDGAGAHPVAAYEKQCYADI